MGKTEPKITWKLGPLPSTFDRRGGADNPFTNRPKSRWQQLQADLDIALWVEVSIDGEYAGDVAIPMRCKTPRGNGTVCQAGRDSFGVVLDYDLLNSDFEKVSPKYPLRVTTFSGEDFARIEPLREKLYDLPLFERWLKLHSKRKRSSSDE